MSLIWKIIYVIIVLTERKIIKINIAECCGSCKNTSKTKIPKDHTTHHNAAKTERWCYKNNIPTMHEIVCNDYELVIKMPHIEHFEE